MSSVKEQVVAEIHKPARKNYRRRKVIVTGLNDLIQADLVEMIPYGKFNKGFRYILVVINALSKFVWVEPVKRKTAQDVTAAMKKVLHLMKNMPKNLQTDNGREFYNREFNELMTKFQINHYSTFSNLKASIVERVNRTLKNLMWKQFSIQGTYKWLNLLPKIVNQYNNTIHSTIKMKPTDVSEKNFKQLLKSFNNHTTNVDLKKTIFKPGDFVRLSKNRNLFSKGYHPNWTTEVFKVLKVKYTQPPTYLLVDQNGQEIQGAFYTEELQKTQHPDVYLVEKIVRKKGNMLYVKWLGLDKKFNSWINKKDVV